MSRWEGWAASLVWTGVAAIVVVGEIAERLRVGLPSWAMAAMDRKPAVSELEELQDRLVDAGRWDAVLDWHLAARDALERAEAVCDAAAETLVAVPRQRGVKSALVELGDAVAAFRGSIPAGG